MKNRILFIALIGYLLPQGATAQVSECEKSAIVLHSHLTEKRYSDASLTLDAMAPGCVSNDQILADVEKVIDYRIAQSADDKARGEHVKKLIELYEVYDKAHPRNDKGLSVRGAMMMDKYKMATSDKILSILATAFEKDRAGFTDAQSLYRFFELTLEAYRAGDKQVTDEVLFSRYDDVSTHINQLSKKSTDVIQRRYRAASNGMRALITPIADCQKITSYYRGAFEKRSSDTLWVESVAKGIYSKVCGPNEFLLQVSEKWFQLAPSAASAENLGAVSMRLGQKDKAIGYMEQAIALEKNKVERAQLRYNLAIFDQSDKVKAGTQLKTAIEENPKLGKAYLLLSQMYAGASDCAKSPFETKALNILAAQTARKAAEAEPALKNSADKQASDFMKKAPTAEEIKKEGMGGKKISFGCWINESVTVPK